jgi:hypothetical protein
MAALIGMKEICNYVKKSEATVLYMIRVWGMPARKITGWVWESDTELIDNWRRALIGTAAADPAPPPPTKKPKRRLDRHRRK